MKSDADIINGILLISIPGFWFMATGFRGGWMWIYFVGGSLIMYLIGLFVWSLWHDISKGTLPEGYKEFTLACALTIGLMASVLVYFFYLRPPQTGAKALAAHGIAGHRYPNQLPARLRDSG